VLVGRVAMLVSEDAARHQTHSGRLTTTPDDPRTARSGRPPAELLVGEKAHTRAGDALAAARRRLPVVALDGTVEVVGPGGPVRFLELCQGREALVADQHMWGDGAPQGQCEGGTPRPGI
jgi:predicted dithiol-disulfide oxidoreductase (DUF899 family)